MKIRGNFNTNYGGYIDTSYVNHGNATKQSDLLSDMKQRQQQIQNDMMTRMLQTKKGDK